MNTPRKSPRTRSSTPAKPLRSGLLPSLVAVCCLLGGCNSGDPDDQMTFSTPQDAIAAVVAACDVHDLQALTAIFGSEHKDLLASDDPAADREARINFCKAARANTRFQELDEGTVEMVVGDNEWPAPVPLVRENGRWRFDVAAGVEEILARRIGRNELAAIHLCRCYLDAQHIYWNRDWDGNGVREFAQRINSNDGKRDGLYWLGDATAEAILCPLDGLVAGNEEYIKGRTEGSPWRGYYVKILTRQGANAPGGAKDYLKGEHMTEGFALIAWPAKHNASGIMTFLVSHNGTVYERDLGSDTVAVASAVDTFDPVAGWQEVK